MTAKERFYTIDIIRAAAILLMILTHVLSWHFNEPYIHTLWNDIHFVVAGLVFCSAYIYAKQHEDSSSVHHFPWFVKRISRIYLPFFIYVIVHYALWLLFPSVLRGYGLTLRVDYFVRTLLLTGGADIGWLPALFTAFAILFPFLLSWSRSKKLRAALVLFLAVLTAVTTFLRVPTEYSRLYGWMPWSVIAVAGFLVADWERTSKHIVRMRLIGIAAGSLVTHLLLRALLAQQSMSLQLTDHKYPPDLFYLSYGVFFTMLHLIVLPYLEPAFRRISRIVSFISRQSYTIFFVHMVVLDAVMTVWPGGWLMETILISVVSIIVAYGMEKISRSGILLRKAHHAVG